MNRNLLSVITLPLTAAAVIFRIIIRRLRTIQDGERRREPAAFLPAVKTGPRTWMVGNELSDKCAVQVERTGEYTCECRVFRKNRNRGKPFCQHTRGALAAAAATRPTRAAAPVENTD